MVSDCPPRLKSILPSEFCVALRIAAFPEDNLMASIS